MLNLYTDECEAFMGQLIIVHDSKINVPGTFMAYTLPIPPQLTLIGTGHATVGGQRVCQEDDETRVTATCAYFTGAFTIPGTVKITISEAKTAANVSSLKPVITAPLWKVKCTVQSPAKKPPDNALDTSVSQEMMVEVTGNPNTFVFVEG